MASPLSGEVIGSSVGRAAEFLRRGGVVAYPTETYYGLAVDPDCPAAVTKLYAVKKRQENKPVLLLIANRNQLSPLVEQIPAAYVPLMDAYWPGPLTLIFQARPHINNQITGQTGTIGIRISPHPLAGELVRLFNNPITATSANISGYPPAQSARAVLEMLGDLVDYVVDGGQTEGGMCSTVVGMKNGRLHLFRPGKAVLPEELFSDRPSDD